MDEELKIPEELPILPIKKTIVFPYMMVPLVITDKKLVELIDETLSGMKIMGACAETDEKTEKPSPDNLYRVGTVVNIVKMFRFPDGSLRLVVQGLSRMKIKEFVSIEPYLRAKVEIIRGKWKKGVKIEALMRNVVGLLQRIVALAPHLPDELQIVVLNIDDPGKLADFIASNVELDFHELQGILETVDVKKRLQKLVSLLTKEIDILEVGAKIRSEVKTEIDKSQREFYLREQLKAIQKELGEGDERSVEISEFRERIEKAGLPEEVREVASKELDRLARIPVQAAEYTVSRTYIDWLVSLPWSQYTEDRLDVKKAKKILDDDHYDLEDVKERICEYLAVRKLKSDTKGPILCFVGPPGVGKTSLGQSVARALGRKFIRVSLGGMRDEAEIRGHRRTYVGALPGRIIQGIKRAGSNNPVFMLDEVDKIGVDFRGDPAAALLEVLDPEQNHAFSDHYLDVPFDLSKVMFITTANVVDPIPPALEDRMETIRLPGYTEEEKLRIAKRYLIPKQLKAHGLKSGMLTFTRKAIRQVITGYTREAGLRDLERKIGAICRKVAKKIAEGEPGAFKLKDPGEYLGPEKYFAEIAGKKGEVGVTVAVAWTPTGGEILFIETSKMKGAKSLTLTGQLGDVMKESAEAALSYIRSNAKQYGIDEDFFLKYDIHLHVPAGAIPKDGPSAGVAMAVSLASALSNRKVKPEFAMTGEITLRGKVLPVGGIKEKVLAAKRAGIRKFILPRKNQPDLQEIPESAKKNLEFIFIETINQALKIALTDSRRNDA